MHRRIESRTDSRAIGNVDHDMLFRAVARNYALSSSVVEDLIADALRDRIGVSAFEARLRDRAGL